ncbi:hypothetical protein PHISP_03615 [Aspergillus sp. HF37]|nr:hypothetical protein PHISP_03615 [Aspergillus sp. HF37]
MCPTLVNGLSDGPAMVVSPSQDHAFAHFASPPMLNSPGPSHPYASNPSSLFSNGGNANSSTSNIPSPWSLASPSHHIPKPSRKRSPPAPPQEEPIYGEGMVLLNPRTGMVLSAESQTGTWYEEAAENAAAAAPPVSSSLKALSSSSDVPGRKSQRLDTSAASLDDIALSSMHKRLWNTDDDNRRALNPGTSSSPFSPGEPLVDDATRLLGISWQQVSSDNDMAAAVRGWTKFIDNQYSSHLQDSRIFMKNRALNAFLVSARPKGAGLPASAALYLFTEDLRQAQLVGSTWETTLQNLRTVPITFEGTEILQAAGRPLDHLPGHSSVLDADSSEAGLPLLQNLAAQPASTALNGDVGMGSGMEIDS